LYVTDSPCNIIALTIAFLPMASLFSNLQSSEDAFKANVNANNVGFKTLKKRPFEMLQLNWNAFSYCVRAQQYAWCIGISTQNSTGAYDYIFKSQLLTVNFKLYINTYTEKEKN